MCWGDAPAPSVVSGTLQRGPGGRAFSTLGETVSEELPGQGTWCSRPHPLATVCTVSLEDAEFRT